MGLKQSSKTFSWYGTGTGLLKLRSSLELNYNRAQLSSHIYAKISSSSVLSTPFPPPQKTKTKPKY